MPPPPPSAGRSFPNGAGGVMGRMLPQSLRARMSAPESGLPPAPGMGPPTMGITSPARVFGNRGQLPPQAGSAPQPVSQQPRVSTPGGGVSGEPHPMSPRVGGGGGVGSFGRQRDEEADEEGGFGFSGNGGAGGVGRSSRAAGGGGGGGSGGGGSRGGSAGSDGGSFGLDAGLMPGAGGRSLMSRMGGAAGRSAGYT